ncbi:MAG: type II secretion system protein [Phycisphaerales bacterium]
MERPRHRHGFARVELAATLAISLVIIAVLLPMSDRQRRLARLGIDMASLRQIGEWTGQYAADSGDRIWTFSWQAGVLPLPPGDPAAAGLPTTAVNDLQAAQIQATYIARKRSGQYSWPVPGGWIAHPAYSQFALAEHLGLELPVRQFVSSADPLRRQWAEDPAGYVAGAYVPNLGTGTGNWRHAYSANFRLPAALFDRSAAGSRVSPGSNTGTTITPGNALLTGNVLTSATYPSQKVLVSDTHARHFSAVAWYATDANARLPLAFVDGHASTRSAADANRGGDPNTGQFSSIPYIPSVVEPPASAAGYTVPMGFFWTQNRLQGRDFGGPQPAFVP